MLKEKQELAGCQGWEGRFRRGLCTKACWKLGAPDAGGGEAAKEAGARSRRAPEGTLTQGFRGTPS